MFVRARAAFLLVLAASAAAAVDACSSDPPTPVAPAADAATTPAEAAAPPCVTSPVPSPFPTGACPVPLPPAKDALDEALAAIGRDRCTLRLDLADVAKGLMKPRDPRGMPGFAEMLEYPLRLPGYATETARWLDDAIASELPVARAIAAAAARAGAGTDACPDAALFSIDPSDRAPLASAVAAASPDADRAELDARVAGVPLDLQRALAPIVRAIALADAEFLEARGAADMKKLEEAPSFVIGSSRLYLDKPLLEQIDGVDRARMARAAVALATAVETAKLARFRGTKLDPVDIPTPFGAIVLRGDSADTYEPGSPADGAALVLDTGGDDTYRVAAGGATPAHRVSIAIDLGGRDRYGYVETKDPNDTGKRLPSDAAGRDRSGPTWSRAPRQGGAFFGVGLLFDLGTEPDAYRSLALSQGAAVFGVGVLFDEGGDDTYEAEALAQGAAAWGVGLVLDRAGNDTYRAWASAQGFGFTRGVGGVVDADGDDRYETDPGDPALGGDVLYANAQLPGKANTAMSQGCGHGNRPDVPEPGFPLPGGLGVLRDARGSDRYVTSVFGQGCAFAMGIGLLLDGAGDDTYEGLWYVQGANAHTGLSYFGDDGGNDRYNPTFPVAATSIGVGHDLSAAIHLDRGGDDLYRGPRGLALGVGNANGIGILANVGGADSFVAAGPLALGAANASEVMDRPARAAMPTVGVFVKAGGSAAYESGAPATPGGTWASTRNVDAGANELAVGIDRPAGSVALP